MAQFDLTRCMGQYLDRHLVFPLLEFLSTKEVSLESLRWAKMRDNMLGDNRAFAARLPK